MDFIFSVDFNVWKDSFALQIKFRVIEIRQRPEFDMFQEALSSILALSTNLVLKFVSVAVGQYLYKSFTLFN